MATTAIAILIVAGLGGCSVMRTDAAFAQMDSVDAQDFTGSITALAPSRARSDGPSEADLALTRNAASDVLTKGDKDSSQPWENPTTGARGSVTPVAATYSVDGRICRDFLASYVRDKSESWLHGVACKSGHGRWAIGPLKSWRRS